MFTPTAVQQQVFSLSWLINSAAVNKWNTSQLQTAVSAISSNIGTWNVVWGPALYAPSSSEPIANAMFVAQGTDSNGNPVYVVAIAGTNKSSTYDWMTEDMDITPIQWPYANNSSLQVTTGDNTGLSILLQLTSGGSTLQSFLHGIQNKNKASLWFTGHSLGGALSPMMTLALMDPNSTLNTGSNAGQDISLSNWGSVSLLATAGPSIGNQDFVNYFFSTLQGSVDQSSFVWNGIDVVPHAWNAATMQQLTSPNNIYGLTLDSTSCLATSIQKLQSAASAQSYQIFQPTSAFSGPLQPYSTSYLWTAQAKFLAQTAYQHINAYVTAFQTSWLSAPTNLCQSAWEARIALTAFNSKACPSSSTNE